MFLDDAGVQINDFTDSANGVRPDREFAFEAPYVGDDSDDVAEYELSWEAYEA